MDDDVIPDGEPKEPALTPEGGNTRKSGRSVSPRCYRKIREREGKGGDEKLDSESRTGQKCRRMRPPLPIRNLVPY